MRTGRFYKLPVDLVSRRDLTPSDKILLSIIAYRIGSNGKCWPGVRRLSQDAGLSVQTVIQRIRRLVKAGFLHVERGGNGRANRYSLPAQSAQETGALRKLERSGNLIAGAQETAAQALKKSEQKRERKKQEKRPRSPGRKSPAPYRRMTDLWCELWAARHGGQKYPFARAKDGQAAQRIWKAVGQDAGKAERVFKAYLADTDPFYEGHPLALLSGAGVLPKFLARAEPGHAGADTPQDRASSRTLEEIGRHMGGRPGGRKPGTGKKAIA